MSHDNSILSYTSDNTHPPHDSNWMTPIDQLPQNIQQHDTGVVDQSHEYNHAPQPQDSDVVDWDFLGNLSGNSIDINHPIDIGDGGNSNMDFPTMDFPQPVSFDPGNWDWNSDMGLTDNGDFGGLDFGGNFGGDFGGLDFDFGGY